ncbi:amidohydrolase family protein [Beijerinckia sp. L45]|uniref:amidohydrolase family protein n=1 Tax=Beijerinckia sp. L45 TaxID=1641855 RepID=UPI00131C0A76|nr:amidohydrolase family protein [Beijerinckia sp. L45]
MTKQVVLQGGTVLRTGSLTSEQLDIAIGDDGRILGVGPALAVPPGARRADMAGKLIVPGLVDAHQHLDKSRTRRRVVNPSGTLAGAAAGYKAYAETVTRDDIAARALQTIEACVAYGTVAIRSHTNIEPQSELRGIEAMVDVRAACVDKLTLQIVAHVTSDATRMLPEAKAWLLGAVARGVDAIGGVPAFSDQPLAFLDMVFAIAADHGLPLDLHIDEHLDPDAILLDAVIERTRRHHMGGRVAVGHCSALSVLPPERVRRFAAGLVEAGVAVITLPAANLFLLGRDASVLPPRGVTRVRELLAAGVPVAAASDNIQDPFVPTGSGDLLEIARWTLLAGQLGLDDLGAAFRMVSSTPAAIMGLGADWGLHVGARADLLITDAADPDDLVASGAMTRTVIVGGRVVAGKLPTIHPHAA